MDPQVPKRIGRYELLCELGRGGMAELYLARLHGVAGFARLVAIKLILPHLATNRTFVDQFLNEGKIAARLSHPNLCQVFEMGEAEGRLYLAMEYLEGVAWEDLAPTIPDDRLRFAVGVLAQACDGLHHAHEQHHIIHRDVSPSNLFVTVDGVCKVLDFGVSKLLSEGKHTRTGILKGKLPYMSPEQIEGAPIDGRSDMFAAGVVTWEALARARLFDRATDFQIWKAITEEPIPRLDAYSDEVNAVIAKALSRKPDDRYPTIKAFADALRAIATPASTAELGQLVRDRCGRQIAERSRLVKRATTVRPTPVEADEPAATMSLAMRGESVVLHRKRRAWPILAAGAVMAAGAAVLIAATRTPDAQPARAPVPPAKVTQAPPPPADAAPEIDAAAQPIKQPPHRPKPPKKDEKKDLGSAAVVAVPQEPGTFTIDSKPFARIYIDGTYVDQTPIFQRSLKAGTHTLRAVLDDGREKTLSIKIAPGKEGKFGTLTW